MQISNSEHDAEVRKASQAMELSAEILDGSRPQSPPRHPSAQKMDRYARATVGFSSLQARVRGVQCRIRHHTTVHGLILLQARVRGMLVRFRCRRMGTAAVRVQSLVRGFICKRPHLALSAGFVTMQTSNSEYDAEVRKASQAIELSAEILDGSRPQSPPRHPSAQKMDRYARATVGFSSLQARVRGVQCRIRHHTMVHGLILLQARVRGMLVRFRCRRMGTAAVRVQSLVRGFTCNRRHLAPSSSFAVLPARMRGNQREITLQNKARAALKIQCSLRSMLQSRVYSNARAGIILLQARIRGFQRRMINIKMNWATVMVQSFFRRVRVRCHLRESSSKAIIVQGAWLSYRKHSFVQMPLTAIKSTTMLSHGLLDVAPTPD